MLLCSSSAYPENSQWPPWFKSTLNSGWVLRGMDHSFWPSKRQLPNSTKTQFVLLNWLPWDHLYLKRKVQMKRWQNIEKKKVSFKLTNKSKPKKKEKKKKSINQSIPSPLASDAGSHYWIFPQGLVPRCSMSPLHLLKRQKKGGWGSRKHHEFRLHECSSEVEKVCLTLVQLLDLTNSF